MAVTIPTTAIRQKDDSQTLSESGAAGLVATFNDDYDVLKTFATSLKSGVALTLDGATVIVKSYQLRRIPGNRGLLSISYSANDTTTSEGEGGSTVTTQTPLEELWEIKSVRNDVSLFAYCGTSGATPNRAFIECWQKEPNAEVASSYSYTKPDGTLAIPEELGDQYFATCDLCRLFEQGIESVMRFYPMLVCTKVYSQCPADLQSKSGYIDTPSPSSGAGSPGLTSFIATHQWLQGPDECARQPDKTWKRVTTWLGIRLDSVPSGMSPWNVALYGPDGQRWTMPHVNSGANSSS